MRSFMYVIIAGFIMGCVVTCSIQITTKDSYDKAFREGMDYATYTLYTRPGLTITDGKHTWTTTERGCTFK